MGVCMLRLRLLMLQSTMHDPQKARLAHLAGGQFTLLKTINLPF